MGILDDAKSTIGDAAEWVKDTAGDVGETLGARARDAKGWARDKVDDLRGGDAATPEQP